MSSNKNFWTDITKSDQYRAINDLIVESRPNGNYFTLLVLSSVIISAGLLLANSAILIGGMLVTPLLTPILLIALGITLGRGFLVKNTSKLILKSAVVIFVVSFVASLIFGIPDDKEFFSSAIFNNTAKAAFLYFFVAFASGIAATFAWVRKKVTNMLPGISIAVSLVPPISLVGVWLAQAGGLENARFFFVVFMLNLVGIIMGSMIVFSMLKFYTADDEVTASLKSAEKDQEDNNDDEEKQFQEKEKYENTEKIK